MSHTSCPWGACTCLFSFDKHPDWHELTTLFFCRFFLQRQKWENALCGSCEKTKPQYRLVYAWLTCGVSVIEVIGNQLDSLKALFSDPYLHFQHFDLCIRCFISQCKCPDKFALNITVDEVFTLSELNVFTYTYICRFVSPSILCFMGNNGLCLNVI